MVYLIKKSLRINMRNVLNFGLTYKVTYLKLFSTRESELTDLYDMILRIM